MGDLTNPIRLTPAEKLSSGGSIVLEFEDESESETLLPFGDFDDEGLVVLEEDLEASTFVSDDED